MRLPKTAQWEYALADNGRGQAEVREKSLEWFSQPNAVRPGAIGARAPNSFGIRDLVGPVWEWTLDFDAFATAAELRDSNGKNAAFVCGGAAAGASDPSDYPGFMRFSTRASLKAAYTADNVGFRCAGGTSSFCINPCRCRRARSSFGMDPGSARATRRGRRTAGQLALQPR